MGKDNRNPRTKASDNYNRKIYDRLPPVRVYKGEADVIQEHVKSQGPDVSWNSYVKNLIYKDMGREEPCLEEVKNRLTDNENKKT